MEYNFPRNCKSSLQFLFHEKVDKRCGKSVWTRLETRYWPASKRGVSWRKAVTGCSRFRTHIDKYSKSGGARRPRKHVFRIPRDDLYRSSIGLLSWDHPLGTLPVYPRVNACRRCTETLHENNL